MLCVIATLIIPGSFNKHSTITLEIVEHLVPAPGAEVHSLHRHCFYLTLGTRFESKWLNLSSSSQDNNGSTGFMTRVTEGNIQEDLVQYKLRRLVA